MSSMMVRQSPSKGPWPWEELERICPGRVRLGVEMRHLTTLRVGGPADALVDPADPGEVVRVVGWCRSRGIPWLPIGRGSNLLVRDGGIRGVVIRIGKAMGGWRVEERGACVRVLAQAGCAISRLLQEAVRRGWDGLSFLSGIPGYMGGAVTMNAGTSEGAMEGIVEAVRWVDPEGELVTRSRRDLSFGYRSLHVPEGSVIVEVSLALRPGEVERVRKDLRSQMIRRLATQPLGRPSAGSIFKNPPGDFAGRLIDRAGLKGMARGGAMVSELHANFILNQGKARASDVLALMEYIQRRVAEHSGVHLEPEVRVVGEDG